MKFFVASSDSNTMTIRRHVDGAFSCTVVGVWKCNAPNGTFSNDREYVIATNTLTVLSYTVNGEAKSYLVSHPSTFLTNPSKLTEGGTTPLIWCVPTSDVKDCTANDVQASVSTQQLSLKGNMAKVWVLTYTGQTIGSYSNKDGVYSTGPETDSYLYDLAYGIWLGYSLKWSFTGVESGGGGSWTEGYVENAQFDDTNLTFTAAVSVNVQPAANLVVMIDGLRYTSSQLPTTLSWFIGTTHSLVVNSTVQDGDTRYVFVQWNDGSTSNSRSVTAIQDATITASYKTQYMLTVISDVGSPQGTGWYDAGTQAAFSVSTQQSEPGLLGALGGRVMFQGWSGDSKATSSSTTITMDGPKTVTAMWTADNTLPYAVIGGIIAALVVAVALIMLMKRKKR
jgi:uncharacterized repeat protein (TIGR02543 family)